MFRVILWRNQRHQIGFEVGVVACPAVRNNCHNRFPTTTNPIWAIAPIFATAPTVTFWVWVTLEVKKIFQVDDDIGVNVFRQKVAGYPIATFRYQILAIGYFRFEINFD